MRIKATCAVSYTFEGETQNRILCDDCTDDAWQEDRGLWLRLLEPGEKRSEVWR